MYRIATKIATGPVPAKEGVIAASLGEIVNHMNTFLTAKYCVENSYRSFADRVKGPWRDALVDHWHEHAKDERKGAYDLGMKIVALGGDPVQGTIQIPQSTANLANFCKLLMDQELGAIEAGRKLAEMAGQNAGLRLLAEEMILIDSHHLDDLRRMTASIMVGV